MATPNSSALKEQLYGDLSRYQSILRPYQSLLIKKYPNDSLEKIFNLLDKKVIALAPMALCDALLADLSKTATKKELAALGLHLLAISTHDDVVDELPKNRQYVAALTYAGNISTNEGSKLLINLKNKKAAEVLLDYINFNHYYQQIVAETLWVRNPKNFKQYTQEIKHICIYIAIGLMYGLALSNRQDLKKVILKFSNHYGLAMQLIDDIREVEEDKINGYYSYPITEGYPYKKSHEQLMYNLAKAKIVLPPKFKNLSLIVDKMISVAKDLK